MARQQKQKAQTTPISPLDCATFRRFTQCLHSKSTIFLYGKNLSLFTKYLKLTTVDDLLKLDTVEQTEDKIIDYLIYLKEHRKVSWNTRLSAVTSLKKFYDMNRKVLNWKLIRPYLGEFQRAVKDRAYTAEEIKKLVLSADKRKKVIVLLLASTGMRVEGLAQLKFKHVKAVELADKSATVYRISVYEGSNSEYFTYCTPEAGRALDDYLESRRSAGEKIKAESPLIRDKFDRDPIRANAPKHLQARGLSHLVTELAIEAGIREFIPLTADQKNLRSSGGHIRKPVMIVHGFRKSFNTNLIRAGLKPIHKEMLLGHRTGLDGSYYRPEESEILEDYCKALELLTVETERKKDVEIHQLKQKVDTAESLQKQLDDLRQQFVNYVNKKEARVDLETTYTVAEQARKEGLD